MTTLISPHPAGDALSGPPGGSAQARLEPLPHAPRVDLAEIRRVLLIQSRWMGDVLLCTPAVRALRRAFPNAHLAFASESAGVDALRGNPHLDELLMLEHGWNAALRVHREVRGRAFDAVVDFRSTTSTARVTALSGAPLRVGWRGRGPRNLAYTHLLQRRNGKEYVARQKMRLLTPLGIDAAGQDASLDIALGADELGRAAHVWQTHALAGERVVAVSPVSRTRHKQWGAERWAAAADALARSGARVLLASGPAEGDQVRAVVDRMKERATLDTEAVNVREIAALYRRCALWVGNDGGLRHVAVAAGVPTVTVFRWQQTPFWSDPDPAARQVGLEEPPPQGCDLNCDACPHLGCLDALAVERVVAAARAQLDAGPPPRRDV
jgi:ADP-heptose:LPS heptosyltransferase